MWKKTFTKIIFTLISLLFFSIPTAYVFADAGGVDQGISSGILDYKLLAPLNGQPQQIITSGGLSGYLQSIVTISIAIAGGLSVVMLIIGGLQYVFSSISESAKSDAKSRITNSIVGLLIILTGYLLLSTINPALLSLNFNLPVPKLVSPPNSYVPPKAPDQILGPGGPVSPIAPNTPPPSTGGPLIGPVSGGLPGAGPQQ